MNFTERARLQGIHPQTGYRWFRGSRLPVPAVQVKAGTALIGPDAVTAVEDRDRPGRMTTAQAGAALAAHGRRLAEPAAGEIAGDLVRDRTGVLTSFCARRYGRGPVRNRAQQALRRAARHVGPSHPGAA